MVTRKDRKRDKRFNLLKAKLEKVELEKSSVESTLKNLQESVAALNVPAFQLLVNQLQDIQRRQSGANGSGSQELESAISQIVFTPEPDRQIAVINGQLSGVETDYKTMYEKAIKERNELAGRSLYMSSSGNATHQIVGRSQNIPTCEASQVVQQLQVTSDQNEFVNATLAQMSGQVNYLNYGTHCTQAQNRGIREPQIVLYEGTQAQRLWSATHQ
jgi:hypothetical protein